MGNSDKGQSQSLRFLRRFVLCAVASALTWMTLPRAGQSFAENVSDYVHLAGHVMGLWGRARTTKYGRVESPNPRASNGTIAEVRGWVDHETFAEKYRGVEPVVFRGAATKENGFNIECFTEGGTVEEVVRGALGDKKVRVFRDEYDDTSCDWMTWPEYESLVATARANKSMNMPYARALPIANMDKCSWPIPEEEFVQHYHGPWALSTKLQDRQTLLFFSLLQDTTTKMHIDPGDSFFTQAYGRKRWLFVDPKYATQLKIYADQLNLVYVAGYDVWMEEIPPHIPVKEVILHPGDVLYFPSMTFHGVQNLDPVTLGVDHAAMDFTIAFKRNWPLTVGTMLNPWMILKTMKQVWHTGKLDGFELYFDGFSKKALQKVGYDSKIAAQKAGLEL